MPKIMKFAFRVSEVDLAGIRRNATRAGMTVTEYLVACALQKDIVVVDGLEPVLRQLKAIGNNLNRLTTLSNMGRVTSPNLADTKEQLGRIYLTLSKIAEVKR